MHTNRADESYASTLAQLRERIQTLNAALPARIARDKAAHDGLTACERQLSQSDRALLHRGQRLTSEAFAFRSSADEFSQHWDTMTRRQRLRHVDEYLDGTLLPWFESSVPENDATLSSTSPSASTPATPHDRDAIRAFLLTEVVDDPKGGRHVTWNGYFIERLTPLVAAARRGGPLRFVSEKVPLPADLSPPPNPALANACFASASSANASFATGTSPSATMPALIPMDSSLSASTNGAAASMHGGSRAAKGERWNAAPKKRSVTRKKAAEPPSFSVLRSRLAREKKVFFSLEVGEGD